MRVLFMGTPDFAVPSLQKLVSAGHEVCAVFTRQDKPVGRGMKLTPPPVKVCAAELGIPVYQPQSLKTEESLELVRSLAPEVIVVVAFGMLLPESILALPPKGCINIHGSVLPKYRGSAPVQWTVLNGDKIGGVSSMYMAKALDAGDVIDVLTTEVGEDETSGELYDRLAELGSGLLVTTLYKINAGEVVAVPQNEDEVTWAPPLNKDMAVIDFEKQTAQQIHNLVRGMLPWPVAKATIGSTVFKVFKATAEEGKGVPGTVISTDKGAIRVACREGIIAISEIQAQGGKRMGAGDYLRGHKL